MLERLDDIDWCALSHAYGEAGEIPEVIRSLTSDDPEQWVEAVDTLYATLCHQSCTVYEATVAAVPFLIELLGDEQLCCRAGVLRFLADAAAASPMHTAFGSLHGDGRKPAGGGESGADAELALELEWVRGTRQAVWSGFDIYQSLLSHPDKRLRITAPYTLGMLALHAGAELPESLRQRAPYASVAKRLEQRVQSESNELVKASLLFGAAAIARRRPQYLSLVQRVLDDPSASHVIKVSAAMCLAEHAPELSPAAEDVLIEALGERQRTDWLFRSAEPTMEGKHHPLAKAYREQGLPIDEASGSGYDADDVGNAEDFIFPWLDGWPSSQILNSLTARRQPVQRVLPAVLPYLDEVTPCTAEDVAGPILRLVFSDAPLDEAAARSYLTLAQVEVLGRLYDNLELWATDSGNVTCLFDELGLSEERADWARLLEIEPRELSDAEIEAIVERLAAGQQFEQDGEIRQLNLRQVGTAAFLPHVARFRELQSLDLSGIEIEDRDLTHLVRLSKLEKLHIPQSAITDTGVEMLAQLDELQDLNLSGTAITDEGLRALHRLKQLTFLMLCDVSVSEEAIDALKAALPDCDVWT